MSGDNYYMPKRDELVRVLSGKTIPATFKTASLVVGLLGMLTFVVGAAMGVDRAWQAFHVNWLFFTTIASGGVMFVAVSRLAFARWSRGVLRFLEAFVAFLPIATIAFLVILFGGQDHIYTWWNHVDTLIPEKQLYFGRGFFYGRNLVIWFALVGLQLWYIWTTVRLDVGVTPEGGAGWAAGMRAKMRAWFDARQERRALHDTHNLQGSLAVAMGIVFGFGWCVLSWDHSMSLDYHFFSTMWGWQVFMGGWLVAIMLWAILLRWWKGQFPELPELITEKHYHDIGKLGFAFTAFWGYLTFSQYLIIWYGNLPEETHFFTLRLMGVWRTTTMLAAILTFVVPFIGLMSVKAKTWGPTMILFALASTIGLWFSRYTEVYPSIYGSEAMTLPLGFWEVAIFFGYLGLAAWSYAQFMDAFPKVRVFMLTSQYRDEVQVPVDPKTMEPLPAHE